MAPELGPAAIRGRAKCSTTFRSRQSRLTLVVLTLLLASGAPAGAAGTDCGEAGRAEVEVEVTSHTAGVASPPLARARARRSSAYAVAIEVSGPTLAATETRTRVSVRAMAVKAPGSRPVIEIDRQSEHHDPAGTGSSYWYRLRYRPVGGDWTTWFDSRAPHRSASADPLHIQQEATFLKVAFVRPPPDLIDLEYTEGDILTGPAYTARESEIRINRDACV